MILIIDASVWISEQIVGELHHAESRRFLEGLRRVDASVFLPTLCPIEVVAGIARPTRNLQLAADTSHRLRRFQNLRLISLTIERSKSVERVVADLRLRGADAVYVALAQEFGATLITWDAEVINRAAPTIPVQTPTDWLTANP